MHDCDHDHRFGKLPIFGTEGVVGFSDFEGQGGVENDHEDIDYGGTGVPIRECGVPIGRCGDHTEWEDEIPGVVIPQPDLDPSEKHGSANATYWPLFLLFEPLVTQWPLDRRKSINTNDQSYESANRQPKTKYSHAHTFHALPLGKKPLMLHVKIRLRKTKTNDEIRQPKNKDKKVPQRFGFDLAKKDQPVAGNPKKTDHPERNGGGILDHGHQILWLRG